MTRAKGRAPPARRRAEDRDRDDRPARAVRRLAAAGVEAVALAMVDNAGVTRVKCIPLRRLEEVARFGVGLSYVFSVFLVNDEITSSPGIEGPSGDMRLVPDPEATVALAASPGWALAPVDQFDQEGEVWPACGRTFAKKMLDELTSRGIELRGAFETEFFLGRRAPDAGTGPGEEHGPIPAHRGPGYSAPVLSDVEALAGRLMGALEAQGTGIMQFHPEYSTGQFEVSVPHVSGLAVADTNLVVRHTIRAVARAEGLDV